VSQSGRRAGEARRAVLDGEIVYSRVALRAKAIALPPQFYEIVPGRGHRFNFEPGLVHEFVRFARNQLRNANEVAYCPAPLRIVCCGASTFSLLTVTALLARYPTWLIPGITFIPSCTGGNAVTVAGPLNMA
jgi:hypothetical protein